jgi:hypothetical protein
MSEIMTKISLAGLSNGYVLALYGRKTRMKIISEMREKARREIEMAQKVLAAEDNDFCVEVVRGVHEKQLIAICNGWRPRFLHNKSKHGTFEVAE